MNNIEPQESKESFDSKEFDTLVLQGGGLKGFCLLGAIQGAMDSGLLLNLKNYVGTSVGAIIAYLLAIGYTPIEIMVSLYTNRWLEKMQNYNLVAMINGNGATSFSSLQEALEKLTINKTGRYLTLGKLKELYNKTLICVSYNMTKCCTEYLSPDTHPDLPCITALRMSCNIPLIFDRFKYMGDYYIDGGISDNFPIKKGEEIGEKIFGLHLLISEKSLQDNPEDGMVYYFLRLLQIPIVQSTKYKVDMAGEKCTIVSIDTGDMKAAFEFNVKSKIRLDMFSNGYNSVKTFLGKPIDELGQSRLNLS